jgi:hypothetical protein
MSGAETTTAPDLKPVSCADCGALGLEHWTDPMPGVCSRCMDARLLAVAAGLSQEMFGRVPPARVMRNHYRRLLEAGMVPAAASMDVRKLAEAAGFPVPKEALAAADARWERATAEYLAAFEESRP